ncbi:unnamed protein product [Adineta steineri]|uniref:NAD(+)--protein-arginine ADP-ribosyltransferase n=1 Tax=Adineta steineri TaxID=433720 RepID=A0A819NLY1_9BILA|nr:unnamed protein product [Adineta steineri]
MSARVIKPDFITDNECYINCPKKRTAYEWHLNDRNDFALKKAKKFRLQYQKLYVTRHWLVTVLLRLNTTVNDLVYAIRKGYLDDINMLADPTVWEGIIEDLKTASAEDEPMYILRAYTRSQTFSKQINSDMAKDTYHELKLYCTPLNCNVLARTQDGIQAFVAILFHPKLDKYLSKGNFNVYRGSIIDNASVLEGYENGSIIITTTFLSTSKDLAVAEVFADPDSKQTNQISLLCEYNIHNYRRTALEMKPISNKPYEEEVLIYPYVPFQIRSFNRKIMEQTGNERIEVVLEEIDDDKMNDNSEDISMDSLH